MTTVSLKDVYQKISAMTRAIKRHRRGHKPPHIVFGVDFIAINDNEGEVVRWVQDEWTEDPNVVFSIANAAYKLGMGDDIRDLLARWATLDDIMFELDEGKDGESTPPTPLGKKAKHE